MVSLGINTKQLDDKITEHMLELPGEIFAVIPNSDNFKTAYTIFCKQVVDELPISIKAIEHDRGGSHGDIRLRFKHASIIIMPLSDYERFLQKDQEFIRACKI